MIECFAEEYQISFDKTSTTAEIYLYFMSFFLFIFILF